MALASVYIDIYITCIRLLISNILMILHSEIHTTQTKNKETKSILYKWLILATYLHSTKKILVHGKNAFKNKTPKSSFQTSSKNAANLWRAAKSQNSLAILKHTTGLYSGFTEVNQCITGINMEFHCPNFWNLFSYLEYLYQTKRKTLQNISCILTRMAHSFVKSKWICFEIQRSEIINHTCDVAMRYKRFFDM